MIVIYQVEVTFGRSYRLTRTHPEALQVPCTPHPAALHIPTATRRTHACHIGQASVCRNRTEERDPRDA